MELRQIIESLNLGNDREIQIKQFLEAVSYYKLKYYIDLVSKTPQITNILKFINKDIKDDWDSIVELYRYNIKVSVVIYPYISLLETLLKTKIGNYMSEFYGKDWCFNENIFFEALELDSFDKVIYEKYFNQKISPSIRNEILACYNKNPIGILTKSSIQKKIHKIKCLISIMSDATEYKERVKVSQWNSNKFINRYTTFNYWLSLFSIKFLWLDKITSSSKISKVFINVEQMGKNKEEARRLIYNKLDKIRVLRNSISHYNRIIGENAFENTSLDEVFENIIEIFFLLGYENIENIVGDLSCNLHISCKNRTFRSLQKEINFIRNYPEAKIRDKAYFESLKYPNNSQYENWFNSESEIFESM